MGVTATEEAVVPSGRRRQITTALVLPADPPIYAAVARRWKQAGRTLPGQLDREWSELVADVPFRE